MIATRKLPLVCCTPSYASGPLPCKRAVVARAAAPEATESVTKELEAAEKPAVQSSINPVTGNPQTGKLIDLYFEFASILAVVVLSFWSMYNVKDAVDQTGSADTVRQPAAKSEWVALDNKDVYGPCGNEGSGDALKDLVGGKACSYSNRSK